MDIELPLSREEISGQKALVVIADEKTEVYIGDLRRCALAAHDLHAEVARLREAIKEAIRCLDVRGGGLLILEAALATKPSGG